MYNLKEDPIEVNNIIESMKNTLIYKEMKSKVIQYEKEWGPEGAVIDGRLSSIHPQMLETWMNSKYPIWMNSQFQKFYDRLDYSKKTRFFMEINKAIGKAVEVGKETLDDDYWISEFNENIEKYNKL